MKIYSIDGFTFRKLLGGGAAYLVANKNIVNDLNVFPVPDGDTGTNMGMTIESAYKKMMEVDKNDIYEMAKAASLGSLMGARGNSGVILSQLLRGFADGLKGQTVMDCKGLANALKQAAQTAYKAVMKPIEGTVLTVARETAEFAVDHAAKSEDLLSFFNMIIKSASQSLERTPELLKTLKDAGVVDAGGQGLLYIFMGAFKSANGEEIKLDTVYESNKKNDGNYDVSDDDIKFGYCTEFMVLTSDMNGVDYLKANLSKLGDSLMVVGADELIKVHVHTNNPGDALQHGLKLGSLKDIKIENMKFQHKEVILAKELNEMKSSDNKDSVKPRTKYAMIAVSMGDGISQYLKDLGVAEIIPGGQTMNPSTADIYSAIEKVNAENIIIFPNNKNILLAAEQAAELCNQNAKVVPTESIPQCIAAVLSLDENESIDDNVLMMKDSMKNVKSGEITFAVRDTVVGDLKIKENDFIALFERGIVSSGDDLNDVAADLLTKMIDDNSSIVTVFYGNDVEKNVAEDLVENLKSEYSHCDFEVIEGKQPLYFYVISVE